MANRKQRRKMKQKQADEYTQSTKSIIITLFVVLGIFSSSLKQGTITDKTGNSDILSTFYATIL